MKLEFNFLTTNEIAYVVDALRAYPKSESEEVRLAVQELVGKLTRLQMKAEAEARQALEDGIPY